MKRLLVCGACIGSMVAVCIFVIMAIGVELAQREKRCEWREAMAQ